MIQTVLACPVCRGDVAVQLLEERNSYELYLCSGCEAVFSHPFSNPGPSWYEEDVETQVRLLVASARKPEEMLREPHRRFLRDRPGEGGRLLDVGCSEGGFLAVAQRSYAVVAGLDFNPQAINLAQERYGLRHTYVMTLDEFIQAKAGLGFSDRFDVLTVFDVLEHVDDPVHFLAELRQLLRPGGWLAINLPNRDRWPNLHECWDYPPHHLTRWNKRSLGNFLSGNGFSVVRLEDFTGLGYLTIDWMNGFGMVQALKRSLVNGQRPSTNGGSRRAYLPHLLAKARLTAAKVADLPLFIALRALGAPGQMLYCLARRKEKGGD